MGATALALGSDAAQPAAARAQAAPIDAQRAWAYFAEARQVSAEDGGRLWGAPLYGPMLFVDPGTRFAAANLPDTTGVLAEHAGVHSGILPRDLPVANTAVEWGGRRWTMVLWPPPEDEADRRRLFAHEMFHRLQPSLGLPATDPPSPHLATAEGRTWLRLEWRALARALRAAGPDRAEAIADALAFRARRHARFPDAAVAERALELNEGLAEYTGVRLSGPTAARLRERAAERLQDFEARESLVRSFAYASGPAYGLLLDQTGAEWRSSVTAGSDLGALLARALRLPPRAAGDTAARAGAYGYDALVREEAEREEALAARRAELRGRFVDGPRLVLPIVGNVTFSFDPGRAEVLEGVGTVYESAEVSAAWGMLAVQGGGVLFLRSDRGFTGIVVPVPPAAREAPHAGEGWRLDASTDWRIVTGDRPGEWIAVPARP